MDLLHALQTRRSPALNTLTAPGPTPEQVESMLTIAARVPDYGKLSPWRFIVIKGDARAALGAKLARIWAARNPGLETVALEQGIKQWSERPTLAPMIIAVVSSPKPSSKIPLWEQQLSAGAACMNLLLAAAAHGFAANWLTEWYASDETVRADFGLQQHEQFAGFIYIGTATQQRPDRDRPALTSILSEYAPQTA